MVEQAAIESAASALGPIAGRLRRFLDAGASDRMRYASKPQRMWSEIAGCGVGLSSFGASIACVLGTGSPDLIKTIPAVLGMSGFFLGAIPLGQLAAERVSAKLQSVTDRREAEYGLKD